MTAAIVPSVRASRDEQRRVMPGDAIVPNPWFTVTHAITIEAPPERVWPWLAQMGSLRGGWYSYDRVDNGGQPSATRVIEAFQRLVPGDILPALPGATDAFVVAQVDPPRDLVLTVPGERGPITSWEHFIEPLGPARSRLIVRGRVARAWKEMARTAHTEGRPPALIEYVYRVIGRLPDRWLIPAACLGHRWMEARHMRGIKRRAELEVTMSHSSAFKTPEGEAAYRAAYDAAMKEWPVAYEDLEIPTRFGTTHVVVSGPKEGPPLVLLHGYMATSVMWSPNIADLSQDYRVYAIDVMGQPSKSIPEDPIRDAADYVAWLTATLDGLHLARVFLVGQSFGGWIALTYAAAAPERVRKLVLLSPGGLLSLVTQFKVRGLFMVAFPTRITVNWFMRWLGITGTASKSVLELTYLGLKHFRMPPETARVFPTPLTDAELRAMQMPVLLLFGDHEVICDPAGALARARRLTPHFCGELVPHCSHDMCFSQHQVVDARVLDFLKQTPSGDRDASTARPAAQVVSA